VPDHLLRPAAEAALEAARAAVAASPPLPVPRPLRSLLRFRKLSDQAVGVVRGVLDDDDTFRAFVAAATEEPLVGRPSWLFLARPPGWDDELAGLVGELAPGQPDEPPVSRKRLQAVEASLRRAEADLESARADVSSLKRRLAAVQKERRDAAAEAGRLRRRVERLEEAAEVAASAAAGSTDPVPVQPAGPAPAPAAPPAPAVDLRALEAALRDANRALGRAAAAVERASPEPAPAPRPRRRAGGRGGAAAATRAPAALPPAVLADTVEAADHLMRLPGALVLVDGYNVTKAAWPDRPLPEQRSTLVDAAGSLAARTGAEVQVVFDGAAPVATAPADLPRRAGVQVRFTREGEEADDAVIGLVAALPPERPVVVVSDDRRVRAGGEGGGANVVPVAPFVELLRR
jgi:hypothetical protein